MQVSHPELVQAIHDLTERIKKGEATVLDVIVAVNSPHPVLVTGEPHFEHDTETTEALDQLSRAIAANLDIAQLLLETLRLIGYHTARGTYGPEFFNKIARPK